jgi:hypothetical protein
MNATVLALLGLATSLGQPVAPVPAIPADVQVTKGKSLSLGIKYNPETRKDIQEVRLFLSQDQGQTWFMRQAVLPNQNEFAFTVKDDGMYFINMQLAYLDGRLDPPDVSRVLPAQKIIIDSTPPVVRVASAQRVGDDVTVEWTVEDKFPNDRMTMIRYRSTTGTEADWQVATDGVLNRSSAKFKCPLTGPLVVQVLATDLAGNVGRGSKEVAAMTTSAYTPSGPPVTPNAPLPPPILPTNTEPVPAGPLAPPALPVETVQPVQPVQQIPPTIPAVDTPKPIAMGSGVNPVPQAPAMVPTAPAMAPQVAEVPAATQIIKTPRFDLGIQLEGGPSGIARVDLYVTRDDGRSWVRWSAHPGTESPLKVILDTKFNQEIEGEYGLKLVPISGAGLSDGAPTAGTTPEMKIHVDTTSPVIKVYQPTPDANNRGALMLHWEATDRNFGRDPIAIEYSEAPTGPWKPVTGGDAVIPVAGGGIAATARVANSGSFSWQLPANLQTPKVYLKFAAVDLAGNRSEVITPNPILVDLLKPKAKIQGIVQTGGVR